MRSLPRLSQNFLRIPTALGVEQEVQTTMCCIFVDDTCREVPCQRRGTRPPPLLSETYGETLLSPVSGSNTSGLPNFLTVIGGNYFHGSAHFIQARTDPLAQPIGKRRVPAESAQRTDLGRHIWSNAAGLSGPSR